MSKLREWRIKNNIKVEDIAEVLGMSKQHVYDLEKGKRRFNEDILILLNKSYGLSSDYLLDLDNKTSKFEVGFSPNTNVGEMKVKDFLEVINSLVHDN